MSSYYFKTYRRAPLEHFDDIVKDLRQVFPPVMYGDFGCVFYNDGSEKDFHSRALQIPSLRNEMLRLNLFQFWYSTAVICSTVGTPVHSDGDPRFCYTLLLPLWNTEGTYTEFFDADASARRVVIQHPDHDIYYDHYDDSCCSSIDIVETVSPIFINTDTPHRVVQQESGKVRVTVPLRLYGSRDEVEMVLRDIV